MYLLARALSIQLTPRALAPTACVLASLCLYNLMEVQKYYSEPQKEQLRDLQFGIRAMENEYPDAFVAGDNLFATHFAYYARRGGADLDLQWCCSGWRDNAEVDAVLALRRNQREFTWSAFPTNAEPGPLARDLHERLLMVEKVRFKRLTA